MASALDPEFLDHGGVEVFGIDAIGVHEDALDAVVGGYGIDDAAVVRARHPLKPVVLVDSKLLGMELQLGGGAADAVGVQIEIEGVSPGPEVVDGLGQAFVVVFVVHFRCGGSRLNIGKMADTAMVKRGRVSWGMPWGALDRGIV